MPINTIIRHSLYLMLLICFISCDNELPAEATPVTESLSIKRKNFGEFPRLKTLTKRHELSSLHPALRVVEDSLFNFSIDSSQVSEISKNGKVYYTMAILRKNSEDNFFENLVISGNNEAYIVQYFPEPEYYERLQAVKHAPFVGGIKIFRIDYASAQRLMQICTTYTQAFCTFGEPGTHAGPGCYKNADGGAHVVTLSIKVCNPLQAGEPEIEQFVDLDSGGTTGGGGTPGDSPDNPIVPDFNYDDTSPIDPGLYDMDGNSFLTEPVRPSKISAFVARLEDEQREWWSAISNAAIKNELVNYLEQNYHSEQSRRFAKNLVQLYIDLEDNPSYLIDISNQEYQNWLPLAQYNMPLSVINKISTLQNQNSGAVPNWDIQHLNGAQGALVNMDFFPITISQFPFKPNTTERYTAAEFYQYFRLNLNQFTAGTAVTFNPSTITGVDEHALWISNNPIDAISSINIGIDNGSVICSKYTANHWYFTTITTPWAFSFTEDDYDGFHPVSGNRAFGYYQSTEGSYVFYVRGIDRVQRGVISTLGSLNPAWESPFQPADDLWNQMKQNLLNFVNNNGGISQSNTNQIHRPNWTNVKNELLGN